MKSHVIRRMTIVKDKKWNLFSGIYDTIFSKENDYALILYMIFLYRYLMSNCILLQIFVLTYWKLYLFSLNPIWFFRILTVNLVLFLSVKYTHMWIIASRQDFSFYFKFTWLNLHSKTLILRRKISWSSPVLSSVI